MKYRLFSFLVATLTFASIAGAMFWAYEKDQRMEAHHFHTMILDYSAERRAALEAGIHSRIFLAKGLAAFAMTEGTKLTHERFEQFASRLISTVSGVRSLQLAPNAVVDYIYPLEGNEAAKGHDLLGDERRAESVRASIDNNALLLAGPFKLMQGGDGIVARLPIYTDAGDTSSFWGFATVVIDVEPLLKGAGLFTDKYNIGLRGIDAKGSAGGIFYGDPSAFSKQAVLSDISLPWGSWQLAVAPGLTHVNVPTFLSPWFVFIAGALVALVVAVLVFMLVEAPRYLHAMVIERTEALHEQTLALSEGQALLKALLNAIPDLIFFKDHQGRYLGGNKAFEDFVGLERKAFVGKNDDELFASQQMAGFLSLDGKSEDGLRHEEWVENSAGERVLYETLQKPFDCALAGELGFISVSRDTTERKHIELALREIADGVSAKVGDDFFFSMTQYLAEITQADYAMVAKLDDEALNATTLVNCHQGERVDNCEFPLANTPSKDVVFNDTCLIERGVADLFPQCQFLADKKVEGYASVLLRDAEGRAIGLMLLMTHQSFKDSSKALSLLKIFAERAASELMRVSTQREYDKILMAVEQSPMSVLITDTQGKIEYVNPAFEKISGYSKSEALGQAPSICQSGRHDEDFYQGLWGTIAKGEAWSGEIINRSKSGEEYWEEVSISAIRDARDEITHYVALKEDLTQKRLNESRLELAETVFDVSSEAVLLTDVNNKIVMINSAFSRITGYSMQDVLGQDPSMLSSGRHDAAFYMEMNETLATTGRWEGEVWNRRKSGEVFPEWLTIVVMKNDDGGIKYYVAVFSDISTRKKNESIIFHQANFDALTDLPNRQLFFSQLSEAISSSLRRGQSLGLLVVDIDRFKWVNDTAGHTVGDELLQQVTERLRKVTADFGVQIARIGGDQFAIVVSDFSRIDRLASLSAGLLKALNEVYCVGNEEYHLTASVGISIFPADVALSSTLEDAVHELNKHAESAMQSAKSLGGDRYCFYTPEMNKRVVDFQRLQGELYQAMERDEFRVYFQPLIHAGGGKVFGAEALVRWEHPQKGLVAPGAFISFAEETGQILKIGNWMLRSVCKQLRAWQEAGRETLHVSVNVSPRQCADNEASAEMLQILHEYKDICAELTLEVTEGLILETNAGLQSWMSEIRELGVRFSVDDFGTGYSSLSYLKNFPVDYLKLDRSFVMNLGHSHDDRQIVKAVAALAHSLNLKVVAEGVEDKEQWQEVERVGVHYLQGYLFSKPLCLSDFESYVDGWSERMIQPSFDLHPREALDAVN